MNNPNWDNGSLAGSVGGLSGSVQYNAAGVLGGDAALVWDVAGKVLTVGDGTVAPSVVINGAANNERALVLETGGVVRWKILANAVAEIGSNNGSNLTINSYDDAGNLTYTVLGFSRGNGFATFSGQVTTLGNISINKAGGTLEVGSGVGLGQVYIKGAAGNNRTLYFTSGGAYIRWAIQTNSDAESGAQAGSNLEFVAGTDDGLGVIGTALKIIRSSMAATFSGNVGVGKAPTKTIEVKNTGATGQIRVGDGTNYYDIGRDNVNRGYFHVWNDTAQEILSIKPDGAVGIGIGNYGPLAKLHVVDDVDGRFEALVLDNRHSTDGSGTAIYMGYNASLGLYGARLLQSGYPASYRSTNFSIQIHNATASNADAAWNTSLFIAQNTLYMGINQVVDPHGPLDLSAGVPKSDTTLYGTTSLILRSNETWGGKPSILSISFLGSAQQAGVPATSEKGRGWQFQTGEVDTNNMGRICLQPYGGDVGIGEIDPTNALWGTSGLAIRHATVPGLKLANNSGGWLMYQATDAILRFYDGTADRFIINPGGNAEFKAALAVAGDLNAHAIVSNNNAPHYWLDSGGGWTNFAYIVNDASNIFSIAGAGNVHLSLSTNGATRILIHDNGDIQIKDNAYIYDGGGYFVLESGTDHFYVRAPTNKYVILADTTNANVSLCAGGGTIYMNNKAISYGANDSAGAGYRTVKIANA